MAKLLQLMVHSVYSDRDVFLRELISNAADALDKLRYEAIAAPALLEGAALAITITPDKAAKTLTIADTGIGMSRRRTDRQSRHHRQVGHPGFHGESQGGAGRLHLIGQFGIGFYSGFIVADKVM